MLLIGKTIHKVLKFSKMDKECELKYIGSNTMDPICSANMFAVGDKMVEEIIFTYFVVESGQGKGSNSDSNTKFMSVFARTDDNEMRVDISSPLLIYV